MGRWSVPGAADGCALFRGGLIGSRGGTIGRTGGCLGPFMRRLTPQVVAQAGRPHCHLSGPAAQERVKATSKRAHAHTSLPPLRGQRAGTAGNASPHQKAKKSAFQQHDLSILIVGPDQQKSDFPAQQSRKVTLPATRSVHPHSWSQPTSIPIFPHQQPEKSPQNQHVLSFNPHSWSQTTKRPTFPAPESQKVALPATRSVL